MFNKIIENTFQIGFYYSLWFWFFIIESLVVLIVIQKSRRKVQNTDLAFKTAIDKTKVSNEKENMSNVVNSIFGSKQLYDTLKAKCHPDRFQDEKTREKANEIFQIITENKYNYAILQEMKKRAFEQLDVII